MMDFSVSLNSWHCVGSDDENDDAHGLGQLVSDVNIVEKKKEIVKQLLKKSLELHANQEEKLQSQSGYESSEDYYDDSFGEDQEEGEGGEEDSQTPNYPEGREGQQTDLEDVNPSIGFSKPFPFFPLRDQIPDNFLETSGLTDPTILVLFDRFEKPHLLVNESPTSAATNPSDLKYQTQQQTPGLKFTGDQLIRLIPSKLKKNHTDFLLKVGVSPKESTSIYDLLDAIHFLHQYALRRTDKKFVYLIPYAFPAELLSSNSSFRRNSEIPQLKLDEYYFSLIGNIISTKNVVIACPTGNENKELMKELIRFPCCSPNVLTASLKKDNHYFGNYASFVNYYHHITSSSPSLSTSTSAPGMAPVSAPSFVPLSQQSTCYAALILSLSVCSFWSANQNFSSPQIFSQFSSFFNIRKTPPSNSHLVPSDNSHNISDTMGQNEANLGSEFRERDWDKKKDRNSAPSTLCTQYSREELHQLHMRTNSQPPPSHLSDSSESSRSTLKTSSSSLVLSDLHLRSVTSSLSKLQLYQPTTPDSSTRYFSLSSSIGGIDDVRSVSSVTNSLSLSKSSASNSHSSVRSSTESTSSVSSDSGFKPANENLSTNSKQRGNKITGNTFILLGDLPKTDIDFTFSKKGESLVGFSQRRIFRSCEDKIFFSEAVFNPLRGFIDFSRITNISEPRSGVMCLEVDGENKILLKGNDYELGLFKTKISEKLKDFEAEPYRTLSQYRHSLVRESHSSNLLISIRNKSQERITVEVRFLSNLWTLLKGREDIVELPPDESAPFALFSEKPLTSSNIELVVSSLHPESSSEISTQYWLELSDLHNRKPQIQLSATKPKSEAQSKLRAIGQYNSYRILRKQDERWFYEFIIDVQSY